MIQLKDINVHLRSMFHIAWVKIALRTVCLLFANVLFAQSCSAYPFAVCVVLTAVLRMFFPLHRLWMVVHHISSLLEWYCLTGYDFSGPLMSPFWVDGNFCITMKINTFFCPMEGTVFNVVMLSETGWHGALCRNPMQSQRINCLKLFLSLQNRRPGILVLINDADWELMVSLPVIHTIQYTSSSLPVLSCMELAGYWKLNHLIMQNQLKYGGYRRVDCVNLIVPGIILVWMNEKIWSNLMNWPINICTIQFKEKYV